MADSWDAYPTAESAAAPPNADPWAAFPAVSDLPAVRGMGGDRPDSYEPPRMLHAIPALVNALKSDTPFGYGAPGSYPEMGNFLYRGARDAVHSVATGAVKTGAGVLDMLGAAASGTGATPYAPPGAGGYADGSAPAGYNPSGVSVAPSDAPSTLATDPVFKYGFSEYQPTTLAGRLFQTGAGGGLLAAPYGLGASLLGALSGVGGQAGGEAGSYFGGKYSPAAQETGATLGSLLLGGIPGLIHGRSTSAEGIANARFSHLTPDEWNAGILRQEMARQQGVPLLATESLNVPEGHAMTADLAQTPQGRQISRSLIVERPDEVRKAVNDQILDPITAQPITTGGTAEKVQNAAERVVQGVERFRSAATEPLFNAGRGDTVPVHQVQSIINQLDNAIAADPGNLNPALRQMRAGLVDAGGAPITSVDALNRVRKIFRDQVELPPTAASSLQKTVAGELPLDDLRGAVEQNSPGFQLGNQLYRGLSDTVVNPVSRGPIGQLANRAGIPENTGIQAQINMIANPDTARPAQIASVAGNLNLVDRTAFPELARTYFENAFDKAQKGPRGAPDAPQSGIAFRQAVHGTPEQRANNAAILEGVAQAHGLPTGGLAAGFNNLMETLDRTGLIPGSGSPTARRGSLEREASSGPLTYVSNLTIDKPSTILNLNPQAYYRARAYQTLANAITSPDGVQALRRLSMYNPQSRQAQAIVGQLAGLTSTAAEMPSN